jgi:uncharacterized protein (DUF1015 family)
MADVQPLRTLRYEPDAVGGLEAVIAPPYDIIDDRDRARLLERSPFNVVEIDLPQASNGGDPYAHARDTLAEWRQQGVVIREDEAALWALEQRYTDPAGERRTRRGFFARVRVEEYGAGRIRPHERTHPGPKEDRLRLTRATKANLSPIFSLFPDPDGAAEDALGRATAAEPFATAADEDGTENSLWRVGEPELIAELQGAVADAELLIADGHHRYETARIYADELGGEGEHRYVLMLLVSLSDPGLTVFPTHRLLSNLKDPEVHEPLGAALKRDFHVERIEADELEPPPAGEDRRVVFGYMDSHLQQPFRLTLKDQSIADAALPGMPEPYRRLDTAVLEALVLRGALKMTEDDISHLNGLGYSRSFEEARHGIESGEWDAGFFMRATPVEQVREVAAAGESMPPKSTYFYPKVPTGLVFNPLE